MSSTSSSTGGRPATGSIKWAPQRETWPHWNVGQDFGDTTQIEAISSAPIEPVATFAPKRRSCRS